MTNRYSVNAMYSLAAEQDIDVEDDLARAQRRLRDLKSRISSQSKKNFVLERDVRYLDSRIALLIQNRMAADEKREVAETLDEVDEDAALFPDEKRMGQYANLFFLLQSEPRHVASLCRLVSLSEIDTLLQTVMFTLYGNQYEQREEHLLLTMFQVSRQVSERATASVITGWKWADDRMSLPQSGSNHLCDRTSVIDPFLPHYDPYSLRSHEQSVLSAQFETTSEFGSLLRANTPVSRMMTTYTRRGPGQSYLKSVLAARINSLIEHKDLCLEINPLKVGFHPGLRRWADGIPFAQLSCYLVDNTSCPPGDPPLFPSLDDPWLVPYFDCFDTLLPSYPVTLLSCDPFNPAWLGRSTSK